MRHYWVIYENKAETQIENRPRRRGTKNKRCSNILDMNGPKILHNTIIRALISFLVKPPLLGPIQAIKGIIRLQKNV